MSNIPFGVDQFSITKIQSMILHQLGDIFGVEFKAIAAEEAIVKMSVESVLKSDEARKLPMAGNIAGTSAAIVFSEMVCWRLANQFADHRNCEVDIKGKELIFTKKK